MILSWVEGRDLEEELKKLSEQQQYLLGRQAGKILKEIHSICVDKEDLSQKTKVDNKLLQLEKYENSKVRVPNDEAAIYVAHASLYSVKWAEKFSSGEIEGMKKRCEIAFENYNNFNEVVPVWYDQTLRLKYVENIK